MRWSSKDWATKHAVKSDENTNGQGNASSPGEASNYSGRRNSMELMEQQRRRDGESASRDGGVRSPKRKPRRQRKDDDDRMTCTSGIAPRAKIKTIKMTLVFVTTFVLCYCPYFVFDLLHVFGVIHPGNRITGFMQCLATLNSAINPIIYSIFNPKVLDMFKNTRFCPPICRVFRFFCKLCNRDCGQDQRAAAKRSHSTYGGVCTETIVLGESIRRTTPQKTICNTTIPSPAKKELQALVVTYSGSIGGSGSENQSSPPDVGDSTERNPQLNENTHLALTAHAFQEEATKVYKSNHYLLSVPSSSPGQGV